MDLNDTNFKLIADQLLNSLSPDSNVWRPAEKFLKSVETNHSILQLQLVGRDEVDATIRVAGVIAFKNFVKRNWNAHADSNGQDRIATVDRDAIKQNIVSLMLKSSPAIQKQFSDAVSIIAKYDFPEKWPQLITEMVEKFGSLQHKAKLEVSKAQQELVKNTAEHEARWSEAQQQYRDLQQQSQKLQLQNQQLKAELGQRTESEATLQYQKGVSENLSQPNKKAKAEVTQANHLLECTRVENRRKLDTDLRRTRHEETFRRSTNPNMMKELSEIRGRQQKKRKNQIRSTHDESRLMAPANEVNADVATQTDRACACAEMEAKLKPLNYQNAKRFWTQMDEVIQMEEFKENTPDNNTASSRTCTRP